jgi:RNA polymerase sigma factor (sigma-70 family)
MDEVRAGIELLFREEYASMHRLAYTMLVSDREAEEVVQDAFMAIVARWDQLSNPGGYLRVAVVNGARKRLRSRAPREAAELRLSSERDRGQADADAELLDIVDSLPERQRTVVILKYYAGLNATEIGAMLGCPSATVRSLLRRALDDMRAVLA